MGTIGTSPVTCGFLILMLGGRIVEPFSAQDDFDFLWFFVTLGKEGYQWRELQWSRDVKSGANAAI